MVGKIMKYLSVQEINNIKLVHFSTSRFTCLQIRRRKFSSVNNRVDVTRQIAEFKQTIFFRKNVVFLIKRNSFHYWEKKNVDNMRHMDSKLAHQLTAIIFTKVAYTFIYDLFKNYLNVPYKIL